MSHEATKLTQPDEEDGEMGNWDREELFEEKKVRRYMDNNRTLSIEGIFRNLADLVGSYCGGGTTSFLVGALGIYGCYFVYGYLQEMMFTDNNRVPSMKVEFTLTLVGVQSFVAFCIATLYNRYFREEPVSAIPEPLRMKLGTCHSMTMICSNAALIYVNYPTQALAKSCKILPVLLVGLLYGKYYPTQRYVVGVMITVGILVFNYAKMSKKTDEENSTFGLLLLFTSLFFDGLNATVQETLRRDHKPHAYDLMASANKYATVSATVLYCVIGLFVYLGSGLIYFPSAQEFGPLISISLCGAFGQCFIFYMVQMFGPLVLTIITTTRKFFTVLISIFLFSHPLANSQIVAMVFVFGAIIYDIRISQKNKQKPEQPKPQEKEMKASYEQVNTGEK